MFHTYLDLNCSHWTFLVLKPTEIFKKVESFVLWLGIHLITAINLEEDDPDSVVVVTTQTVPQKNVTRGTDSGPQENTSGNCR